MMNLEQIFASSNAHNILKHDLTNGMRHHAYFLVGNSADTLTVFAKSMAKQLLCPNVTQGMFCNNCRVCKNIDLGIFSDCLTYPKSGTFKVEDANSVVTESFVAPFEGDLKVFLLNNFDQSTIPAQNKLLKTLEETNSKVVFLLTATNANAVLETIQSRCKHVNVFESLQQNKTQEQEFYEDQVQQLLNKLNHSSQILQTSAAVMECDDTVVKWLSAYQNSLANTLANKLTEAAIPQWAEVFTPQALAELFYKTIHAQKQITANCNKQAVAEQLLIQFLEVRQKCLQ